MKCRTLSPPDSNHFLLYKVLSVFLLSFLDQHFGSGVSTYCSFYGDFSDCHLTDNKLIITKMSLSGSKIGGYLFLEFVTIQNKNTKLYVQF